MRPADGQDIVLLEMGWLFADPDPDTEGLGLAVLTLEAFVLSGLLTLEEASGMLNLP